MVGSTITGLCLILFLYGLEARPATSDDTKIKLSPLQEECLQELKLSDQREAIHGLNNRAICPEDNQNYNKFISCFWKKTGRQNENGDVNYDTIKSFVREGITQAIGNDEAAISFANENADKIVNGCKNISGENPEMIAVKVRNCIVRGVDAVGGN